MSIWREKTIWLGTIIVMATYRHYVSIEYEYEYPRVLETTCYSQTFSPGSRPMHLLWGGWALNNLQQKGCDDVTSVPAMYSSCYHVAVWKQSSSSNVFDVQTIMELTSNIGPRSNDTKTKSMHVGHQDLLNLQVFQNKHFLFHLSLVFSLPGKWWNQSIPEGVIYSQINQNWTREETTTLPPLKPWNNSHACLRPWGWRLNLDWVTKKSDIHAVDGSFFDPGPIMHIIDVSYVYLYINTWNPNYPSFGWKRPYALGRSIHTSRTSHEVRQTETPLRRGKPVRVVPNAWKPMPLCRGRVSQSANKRGDWEDLYLLWLLILKFKFHLPQEWICIIHTCRTGHLLYVYIVIYIQYLHVNTQ